MGTVSVCDAQSQERVIDYQQFGQFSPSNSRVSTVTDYGQKISLKRHQRESQLVETNEMLNEISDKLAELTNKIKMMREGENKTRNSHKDSLRQRQSPQLKGNISTMKTTVQEQPSSRFVTPVTHLSKTTISRIQSSRML